MENKKRDATLPSTHTPEGASNDEVNRHLDKLILDREEQPDWNTPWRARKFAVTVMSTLRNLFVLCSNRDR
jgi:hypothetical protein